MTDTAAMTDSEAMDLALAEAALAPDHDDVPVGAVVLVGSQVVARRHNERELLKDPTAHAEILALRDAAEWLGTWRLDGATLVVTLEPCAMCAGAVVLARVRRLVFGSSASLYDGLGPGMFDEQTPVAPRGAYSISKRYGEEALLRLAGGGFAPTILRQGTVYGYSARMRFDLVVNTFVRDAITRHKLFLHGGGWQWRPLVDVTDVARAHVVCLDAPLDAVGGEIFNLMQENYQVRQLAMLVAGSLLLLGRTVKLEDAPLPKIVRDYRMTNLKMTQRTGFTPAVTVLESIDAMLKALPIDDVAYLTNPRHNNIAWMTMLEETHAAQRPFASIY